MKIRPEKKFRPVRDNVYHIATLCLRIEGNSVTTYMTLNRALPYGIGTYMRRDF